jgi:hypothetical protein
MSSNFSQLRTSCSEVSSELYGWTTTSLDPFRLGITL